MVPVSSTWGSHNNCYQCKYCYLQVLPANQILFRCISPNRMCELGICHPYEGSFEYLHITSQDLYCNMSHYICTVRKRLITRLHSTCTVSNKQFHVNMVRENMSSVERGITPSSSLAPPSIVYVLPEPGSSMKLG